MADPEIFFRGRFPKCFFPSHKFDVFLPPFGTKKRRITKKANFPWAPLNLPLIWTKYSQTSNKAVFTFIYLTFYRLNLLTMSSSLKCKCNEMKQCFQPGCIVNLPRSRRTRPCRRRAAADWSSQYPSTVPFGSDIDRSAGPVQLGLGWECYGKVHLINCAHISPL